MSEQQKPNNQDLRNEYNPAQTFCLHVYWVVRSPAAAAEMISKGFAPCSNATMRDTPTTLTYCFRLSRDQRLAQKLKNEVVTIGQHPHYAPSFKLLQMGMPRPAAELKLKTGGIDPSPLAWGASELIAGHEKELDYDPVVLECTEVYLDNKSFYEHARAKDFLKNYTEIVKPSRNLSPMTYCLGDVSDDVWNRVVEPILKAKKINGKDEKFKILEPGVFVKPHIQSKQAAKTLFIELDICVKNDNVEKMRSTVKHVQEETEAPVLIVLPHGNDELVDSVEVRIMASIPLVTGEKCDSLGLLQSYCESFEGRVFVFKTQQNVQEDDVAVESSASCEQVAKQFLEKSGLDMSKIKLFDAQAAAKDHVIAGYPLHPLHNNLVANPKAEYKL